MNTNDDELFYTYKTGALTIIGFDGQHLTDRDPERYQDALLSLLQQHLCEILVVDLMDVPVVHSWVLGVLVGIHKQGVRVELYHPTLTMQEVLDRTHLNKILHVRDGL
jgi:anti-anti-sigma regulatory factor